MSTRRVWRVFTLANPSIQLSPYTDEFGTYGFGPDGSSPYPFSVQPEKPLTLEDIKKMARDNFDNTPLITELLALRHEKALLLGFDNFAALSLATKMAQSPDEVVEFIEDLVERTYNQASKEFKELEGLRF